MASQARLLYVLMPFRDELRPVYECLQAAAHKAGFMCLRADEDEKTNMVKGIIERITEATVLIADLTYSNPNVLYELGVANALSKDTVMICQYHFDSSSNRGGNWVTSRDAAEGGTLPFDLASFAVKSYSNTPEGLSRLKEVIAKALTGTVRFESPVNPALDALINRNRIASYLLWGGAAGFFIGIFASLASVLLGTSLLWKLHGTDMSFRTIFHGSIAGFFIAAPAFAIYAGVYKYFDSDLRTKRSPVVFAELFAGALGGLLCGIALFFHDLGQFGAEIAVGTPLAYWILITLGGGAIGLSMNLQHPREREEPVAGILVRSVPFFLVAAALAVALIHGLRTTLFSDKYLDYYSLAGIISDALRYALWGVGITVFHWWLKWRKRFYGA